MSLEGGKFTPAQLLGRLFFVDLPVRFCCPLILTGSRRPASSTPQNHLPNQPGFDFASGNVVIARGVMSPRNRFPQLQICRPAVGLLEFIIAPAGGIRKPDERQEEIPCGFPARNVRWRALRNSAARSLTSAEKP